MTHEEARELLLLHSGGGEDRGHPKSSMGFVGSLRPFTGLQQQNYGEVMQALKVLAPEIASRNCVDRQLMASLWYLCWQSQLIGLHSTGALQRNGIISPEEIDMLEDWVFNICYSVAILLESGDIEEAFAGFQNDS
jgi:hypothetical protein